MIMDGLDTLSQVALADQIHLSHLSFENYHSSAFEGGRLPSESVDDCLNTPVTTCSDVTFFHSDTFDAVPITGTQCTGRFLIALPTQQISCFFQKTAALTTNI